MSMYANESTESLKRRLAELDTSQLQAPSIPEHTWGERGLQAVRGLGSSMGSTLDVLANSHQSMPGYAAGDYAYQEPYAPSKLGHQAEEAVDTLAGRSLAPEEGDTAGHIAHGIGEFMNPLIPGAGYLKGAKLGVKGLAKVLGKEASAATGASTLMHGVPQMSEEGSLAGVGENMLKGVIGARAGQKVLSPEALKSVVTAPKKALTELPAKVMSWGTEPNKEVFELAEKHGVELPSNVGMGGTGGKAQNWVHNNFLKSIFTSGKYKKAIEEADQSMIDAVKRNIDTLGPSQLKPSEASGEYKRHLKTAEQEATESSKKLYNDAEKILSEKDKIVPKHTITAIEDMRELLNRDIKAPGTKKIVDKIAELADRWGINPNRQPPKIGFGKTPKDVSFSNVEAVEKNPEFINKILDSMQNNKTPIHLGRLNGVRKELLQMTDYDPDVRGVKGYLKKLIGSISDDMESAPNQPFVEAWKAANQNFKHTIGDVFRKDMAESIMTGQMPVEAFNMMSNARDIKELGRIAGETAKGREIFDALKKAKVRDIFANTLNEEKLSTGNFINLFKKEGQQETLAALLPPDAYHNMVELTKVAREYQKAGRDLLNTSGTSWVTADITRINEVIKNSLKALYGAGKGTAVTAGIGAAAATAGAGPLASSLIAAATPNLVSRMVSNPEIVKKARAYALARMNGNEKGAENLMKQLMKMSEKDAKAALVAAQQSTKEEKE